MIHQDWPLGIVQSVIRHFYTGLTESPLNLYTFYEGMATDDRAKYNEWTELRLKGPDIVELSKGYFHAEIVVDILVQSTVNQNIYYMPKLLGEVAALYVCIPVILYADDDDPDNDYELGILDLLPSSDIRSGVKITSFNRLVAQPHQRGNVYGVYEMDFQV